MRQPPPSPMSAPVPAPDAEDERLRGHWPSLVRAIWLTLVIVNVTIFFGSLPVFMAQLRTPCTATTCAYQQLSPAQIEAFKGIGFSLDAYVALTTALLYASASVNLAVSALIIWRRSESRMAVLVAMMLVAPVSITSAADLSVATTVANPWLVPNQVLITLATAAMVLVFLVFPTGHFVPRWMRWVALVYFVVLAVTAPFQNAPVGSSASAALLGWYVALAGFAMAALVQIYRYRRVSTPVQRQQTKWVAFGFAVPILIAIVGSLLNLVPALGANDALYALFFNELTFVLEFGIPLGFGVAILHSHLWGIDTLINRALVYGSLTGILAVVYIGLIIGLQALLGGIISRDNSIAIVLSTLVIAALFNPLRRRIQAAIDRRFYRRKYDAARTLAAFSASLRSEVNLAQLDEQLVTVVRETMQPAQISLWLKNSSRPRIQPPTADAAHAAAPHST